MKRIHIVGVSPRTGTTLLAEAMKCCFDIEYCTDHEDELYTRAPNQPSVFLSKCPRDIMKVGPSLKVDPHLFVLCMMRDPRDIIVSRHKKDPSRYWAGLKFWKLYTQELRSLMGLPRFTMIRYENFASNPDEVQKRIAREIPFLEKLVPFSKYHEVAEVSDSSREALRSVRPIRPTSVGTWKEHKPRVAGQIELHGPISKDLIAYDYEGDKSWLAELEDVSPDLEPSHFSEYMSWKDEIFLKMGRHLEALRRIIEGLIGYRIRITHPKKWLSFELDD